MIGVQVSEAAFSKARYKIKPKLFKQLSLDLLVLAIDGSTTNLPSSKNIEAYFGVYSTNKHGCKRYLARMLMVYDVLNDFVVSSRLSKMFYGESRLMMDCIREIVGKVNDHIYVMDRNFDSFALIKSVLKTDPQSQLCVRLSSRSGLYQKVLDNPKDDFITLWTPSRRERKNCESKELDTDALSVRITKVVLNSGEVEVLVSTLYEDQKYTSQDLATLYSLRWGVEEGFKNLKPKMKLEHYGCKKVAGVYQEFYAHILMMNLVALHGMIANEQIEKRTNQRKYSYTYNWKNGYRFVRASIVELFSMPRKIMARIGELIDCFQQSIVAIKPGRSFVRDMRWNQVKTRITHYNK